MAGRVTTEDEEAVEEILELAKEELDKVDVGDVKEASLEKENDLEHPPYGSKMDVRVARQEVGFEVKTRDREIKMEIEVDNGNHPLFVSFGD